uniref:Ig-like domain-containing protein n=1 Tax=Oryzias latipes TaxID=8090 RepID=A0A3P9H5V0_ORYLA
MKMLCFILLFCDSLQLSCDRRTIIAHIGGEFLLTCMFEDSFYFSKKYWCRGPSRGSCEILADSEGVAKTKYTHRSVVVQVKRRVFVKVTNLQIDDSGVYWVGIDKPYSDIMVPITLNVTQVPVSKPRIWPLNALVDRPTCWGQPVTVRCGPSIGTGVRYAWYHRSHNKDILLSSSSDLTLHCGTVKNGDNHYCLASNDVSSEKSDILSVQVLQPADKNCIYAVRLQGQPSYDCADRMSTAAVTTSTMAPSTFQASTYRFSQINQTEQDFFFSKASAGLQLWYQVLRWSLFASLLIFLCVFLRVTRTKNLENDKRKRMFYSRPDA